MHVAKLTTTTIFKAHMKNIPTSRGFSRYDFEDRNGHACSMQKSSIATEDCIWLGIDDADPQIMIPNEGWKKYDIPEEVLLHTRMHLNKEQVRELLPHLMAFVSDGELE